MSSGVARLQTKLDSALGGQAPVDFVFVNLWILGEDLAPSGAKLLRHQRQLSVEAGIAREGLSVPPTQADTDRLLKLAFDALELALSRLGAASPK
jgi:hypothetical protein